MTSEYKKKQKEALKNFLKEKTLENRNKLVEAYMPLVTHSAKKRHRQFSCISVEEFMSEGTMGLISAANCYDINYRTKFITLAYKRIDGRMLNKIRDYTRQKKKEISNGMTIGPAVNNINNEEDQKILYRCLATLTEEEYKIIDYIYFRNYGLKKTQKELNTKKFIFFQRDKIIKKLRKEFFKIKMELNK